MEEMANTDRATSFLLFLSIKQTSLSSLSLLPDPYSRTATLKAKMYVAITAL
jgi:hypothetical protein